MSKLREIIDSKMVAIKPTEAFSAPDEVVGEIKDLILDRMDDIDPFHTAEWYVKLHKKVEEL